MGTDWEALSCHRLRFDLAAAKYRLPCHIPRGPGVGRSDHSTREPSTYPIIKRISWRNRRCSCEKMTTAIVTSWLLRRLRLRVANVCFSTAVSVGRRVIGIPRMTIFNGPGLSDTVVAGPVSERRKYVNVSTISLSLFVGFLVILSYLHRYFSVSVSRTGCPLMDRRHVARPLALALSVSRLVVFFDRLWSFGHGTQFNLIICVVRGSPRVYAIEECGFDYIPVTFYKNIW